MLFLVQAANVTNGTLTYNQKQALLENQQAAAPVEYLIPSKLVLIEQPSGGNETLPLQSQPQLRMYDALNRWVPNLGRADALWQVTAFAVPVNGDSNVRVEGNMTVSFTNGTANFTNIALTHNGTYKIRFNVTYPPTVKFSVESDVIEIKERELYFVLTKKPGDANETVPFGQQPQVEVRDAADNKPIARTGWKGRQWLFVASLIRNGNQDSFLNGSTTVDFIGPHGIFTNLSIDTAGNGYQLMLEAKTVPASRYAALFTSKAFNVKERELFLHLAQQPGDCNDTVICGNQPVLEVRSRYPDAVAGNLGWKGRKWYLNTTLHSGANNDVILGTTYFRIPKAGLVMFTDLKFENPATGYRLVFSVITEPFDSRFANMTVISNSFDVKERQFFLYFVQYPENANDSVPFGQQPIIEVRDLGTNLAAKPLKKSWTITVQISSGSGTLSGTTSVNVLQERASFTGLTIAGYGTGYILRFSSNYGHQVISVQ